jgi:glycosyltransferase involved in cell wall biosynthesis
MRFQRGLLGIVYALKNFFVSLKYILEIKFIHKADIIHSNTILSNIYFAIWAKIFNIKFIAHSHEIRNGFLFKILHKYIIWCSNKVITVSDAVRDNWLSHGVDEKKIITIYNGLDNDFF